MKNVIFFTYRYLIIFIISGLLLDRITKLGVLISGGEFSKNLGIAFGFADNVPGILFFLIALGLVGLIYFGKNLDLTNKTNQIAVGLILAGGISNILDRIFYGYVIDFIDIFNISTFNFADLLIISGSIILIGHIWNISKD